MIIRRAVDKDYKELLAFYERMCQVLGEEEFLPDGDKGGFPSGEMIKGAIVRGQQFVGIEDERIVAAYIMDHDCDKAYDLVKWQVNAEKEKVVILHALRVLPEYGKRGYSRKLVEHAISTAEIRLDCIEGNEIPQKMYRSFGFQYRDTVEITYADIGVPRKFLVYERVL